MKTIYLDPEQVPSHLRGTYSGKQFKAVVTESWSIPADAGLWAGGSRETYLIVRLADGAAIEPVNHQAAPWDKRADKPVKLEPGIAVVRHSMFSGKDMGLTFYIHPADVVKMLPAGAAITLTAQERSTLEIIDTYKSSYRLEYAERAGMSRAVYDETKTALIARGLLNKSGAITNAGRNALAV
jgi:hypothetical protein